MIQMQLYNDDKPRFNPVYTFVDIHPRSKVERTLKENNFNVQSIKQKNDTSSLVFIALTYEDEKLFIEDIKKFSSIFGALEEKESMNFNINELRHLAVNYAINCMKGYDGSFDDWFDNISKDWKEIANCRIIET